MQKRGPELHRRFGRGAVVLAASLASHGVLLGLVSNDRLRQPIGQRFTQQAWGSLAPTRFHARSPADAPASRLSSAAAVLARVEHAPLGLSPTEHQVPAVSHRPPQAQPEQAVAAASTPVPLAAAAAATTAASAAAGSPAGFPHTPLPTRIPDDFDQRLQVRRGLQVGQGRWAWSVQAGRYRTSLQVQWSDHPPSAAPSLNWSSQGGLDEHGLAPERFLTQPARGGARAVNFQRDTNRVSYSGPTGQAPLLAGAQDRLSWMAQLLALVQAHPHGQGLPAELPLWVAGPQGDGAHWWFEVRWHPATECWQFSRRPEQRYEVQVQAWVKSGPDVRLVRLDMGPQGGRQPAWQLSDLAQPEACGALP